MRQVVLSMFMSLDGYICGPDGEFIPPRWSDDLERHWSGYALARAGRLLYGRKNFLFNKDFWSPAETDPSSVAAGIPHAATMNRLPKTVFSRTLPDYPGWNGTVVRDDLPGAVAALKAEGGGDLTMFGGAEIAGSFMALDLIDEYRLMVTPNLLGRGKRLFEGPTDRLGLALLDAQPLDTGAVILRYRRERGG
ncbi:MAG TPA: dihydrofolate reductase family protein [Alphaproteobacteria bacterium]|nr:dihydrofolate reductase family protein [Alphaproteobacteria bacterium]